MEQFDAFIGPQLFRVPHRDMIPGLKLGRLASTCSGAGNICNSIGNYVKQRLLAPFHNWLAAVLRTIPMDGTFNQSAPLDRLIARKCCVFLF